jgi:hypothetical protein
MTVIDQWIVRRLLEQTAEEVDQPLRDPRGAALKELDWGFTSRLARNPKLPDPTDAAGPEPDAAIADFLERLGPVFQAAYEEDRESLRVNVESRMAPYLDEIERAISSNPSPALAALAGRWRFNRKFTTFLEVKAEILQFVSNQVVRLAQKARKRLSDDRTMLKEWLGGPIMVAGEEVHRYWRFDTIKNKLFHCFHKGDRVEAVDDVRLRCLAQEYRIIVYAATPPDTYPGILREWSSYAERIALEKPVAGLLQSAD